MRHCMAEKLSEVDDKITEIRLYGRGGQGAALASTMLAVALFKEGKYVNSFPLFGAERRGAPVTTFVRACDDEIMPRCRLTDQFHYAIVFDISLMETMDVFNGLIKGGTVLLNSDEQQAGRILDIVSRNNPSGCVKLFRVDASAIALSYGLGAGGIPAINAVMLGAFAAVCDIVTIDSVLEAIRGELGTALEKNIDAAKEGFSGVKEVRGCE